jgi:hypothetical protein
MKYQPARTHDIVEWLQVYTRQRIYKHMLIPGTHLNEAELLKVAMQAVSLCIESDARTFGKAGY